MIFSQTIYIWIPWFNYMHVYLLFSVNSADKGQIITCKIIDCFLIGISKNFFPIAYHSM